MSSQKLLARIAERGWKARIVAVDHLRDLREAIEGRYRQGLLSEALYRQELEAFRYQPPEELPDARSIIIVALPAPQLRVRFHWRGARVEAAVPPTYSAYAREDVEVRAQVAGWLNELGHRAAKPLVPLKTLAVRSGLAEWGRNNLTYVPGFGSFFRLVGVYSDLPCPEESWREPRALERCASCVACVRRCPTQAITEDRFLLDAARCIVFHNESARPLPEFVQAAPFDSIVGCMRCQIVCPENKEVRKHFEDRAEFSEEETALLEQRTPLERLPQETAAKLRALELNPSYYEALCRNIGQVLRTAAPRRQLG